LLIREVEEVCGKSQTLFGD